MSRHPHGDWRPTRRSRRDGQRGFALLLVFAMAAMVAIFLYMQLPRVAFEAQRDREEMLIQRGKEYKRAIELYVRKNNRYPQNIEDLERQQDVRYLRRKYKDPLTESGEWRLIHINAAGQLEDSLIQKAKPGEEGGPEVAEEVAENTALARQRAGDQLAANANFPGGEGNAGPVPEGQQPPAVNPLDEGLVPMLDASGNVIQKTKTEAEAQAQQAAAAGGLPGAIPGTTPDGNPPANAGRPNQPRLGPGGIPIIENPSAVVGQPPEGQTLAGAAAPLPPGAQTPGAPPTRGTGAQGQRGAAEILSGLLTTPVPGGLQGLQQRRGIAPSASAAPQGFGAGIAGVASKLEMRGIKVYDEQDSIHKWEFVFDARRQANEAMQSQGRQGGTGQVPGAPGMAPFGFGQGGPQGSGQPGGRGGRQPSPGGFTGPGRPGSGPAPFPPPGGGPQRPR